MTPSLAVLDRWLVGLTQRAAVVYVKRLSANDTSETRGHQAGTYLPKRVAFRVVPDLQRRDEGNPRQPVAVKIVSHGVGDLSANLIYYNNKHREPNGTRDEVRLTGFGGKSSPLLDHANTGTLAAFAFLRTSSGTGCDVWVCHSSEEEDRIESYTGDVDPGMAALWEPSRGGAELMGRGMGAPQCRLRTEEIPEGWMKDFPSGADIIAKTLELVPARQVPPDKRLLRRRTCEYEVFRSVEEAHAMPTIEKGFRDFQAFYRFAQTVLQRRRARSGLSLELHVRAILAEEGLVEGNDFGYNVESDGKRRPDFLFPSTAAYRDSSFPREGLIMLGAKTTCKDRWRQILNEASPERIPQKHLVTLQEGVSPEQHDEMRRSGVQLIVPSPLHSKYPEKVRKELWSLGRFLEHVRTLRRYWP